ncbi:MAG: CPBP family intramembrane metalloprotease [Acidobacteriota bacterium]|nr:CPBP family intramembrane metalloprotease [Acidobacteriota bacterium]
MEKTRSLLNRIGRPIGIGILGFCIAIFAGGVWSALLTTNLRTSPAIPWSVPVMAVVVWAMWRYLGGDWWPRSTAEKRRQYLRANSVPRKTFFWALTAGVLSVVALAGLWIVMFQLVRMPGNVLPDMSKYPPLTASLMVLMGSLVSPFMEEATFRGYFQVALEQECTGAVAVLISSFLFALGHFNHGLLWPKLLVYFLAGLAFGTTAFFTKSTLPAIPVHFIGDMTFFTLVWPNDTARKLMWEVGPDRWFWIHSAQVIVFGTLAIWAYTRLAKTVRRAS